MSNPPQREASSMHKVTRMLPQFQYTLNASYNFQHLLQKHAQNGAPATKNEAEASTWPSEKRRESDKPPVSSLARHCRSSPNIARATKMTSGSNSHFDPCLPWS